MNRRNFIKGIFAASTVAALAPIKILEFPTEQVSFDVAAQKILKDYSKIIADSITQESPIWRFLKKQGYVNTAKGYSISEPIYY